MCRALAPVDSDAGRTRLDFERKDLLLHEATVEMLGPMVERHAAVQQKRWMCCFDAVVLKAVSAAAAAVVAAATEPP